MLGEHEAGKKEYQMFLDVIKSTEDSLPVGPWTGYIDLLSKAIEKPDEYAIAISDQPLPAPIPSPDDPGKVQIVIQFNLDLIFRTDNTVVSTYTVGL